MDGIPLVKDTGSWVFVCLLLMSVLAGAMLSVVLTPTLVSAPTLIATPVPPALRLAMDPPGTLYGVASWYGKPFHGRKTASGAIYDMGGYSVAHKELPMGIFVIIQNRDNGRWCVAVINDRGPYIDGRDWDVSAAVAGRLGMVYRGLAHVKVRIIDGY